MKPKYLALVFIITITIALSGCSGPDKNNKKQKDSDTIKAVQQTVSSDKNSDDSIKDPNSIKNIDEKKLVAEIPDSEIRLYYVQNNKASGMYEGFILQINGMTNYFPWKNVSANRDPQLILSDLDKDNKDELIVILDKGYGTGVNDEEIHIIKLEPAFHEILSENPLTSLDKNVSIENSKEQVKVLLNMKTIVLSKKNMVSVSYEELKAEYGHIITFQVENNLLTATVPLGLVANPDVGEFIVKYKYSNNNEILQVESIDFTSDHIIASSESKPENNKNSAMEAYKKVLQNKVDFYSTENRKKVYLNDFLTNKAFYGATFEINHFAVLDMDGDKIPEVVLGLTVDEDPSFVEVLHYMNNEVYGYFFGKHQLCDLKADGTFRWLSGGITYYGYGKLKFQNKSCEVDKLAYLDSRYNDESYTTLTTSYYINNKLVTKESYQSFAKEEDAKKDVKWYGFSKENISTVISKTTER